MLRRRSVVVICWAIAAAILLPGVAGLGQRLEVGTRVAGSESDAVERELSERFGSPYAQFAVLVMHDAPSPLSGRGRAFLDSVSRAVRLVPGVTKVRGYATPADTFLLGSGGKGEFVLVGLDQHHGPPDVVLSRLRAATSAFRGATPRWTGQIALNSDLRRVSANDARTAERRVLPLALLLLLLAFGSLIAASLPVIAGLLTILLAFGSAGIIAARWPLSIMLQNVVSMIGLGLGIDYALLAVTRFREALDSGESSSEAAAQAARHAGHTIGLSGLAVAVGFAGLLVIPVNELRSVAVGGLLTVAIAVLTAITLLPALLSWLGRRVDLGRVTFFRGTRDRSEAWRRWGLWVARRPVRVLVVASVPIVALAWQAHRMRVGDPSGDWLPPRMESAIALRDLQRMGRSGVLRSLRVVADLPAGAEVQSSRGWAALRQL